MPESFPGDAGMVQVTLQPEIVQNVTPLEDPSIFDRLRNKWNTFIAAGAALVAFTAAPIGEQPAYAETSQVSVGMPFDGKWAYSTLTNADCGSSSGQTSHPSCHENYSGDWSTDIYAAADTEVKLKLNGEGLSFAWDTTANGTCGETRRIKVFKNDAYVGRVHYTHLKESAATNSAPTNGMVLGKIANLACNPGGTGKHVHIELDNANNDSHACYINHSTTDYKAGQSLTEGTALGRLGSSNTGNKQACAEETPPPSTEDKTVTAVSSQITPDGITHVYWADRTGKLKETWFKDGVKHTNIIKDFGITDVTEVSSQYTAADNLQHVYAGTTGGELWELWFGPNTSGYQGRLVKDVDSEVTAMSSQITPDGIQRIYWADMNRRLYETWYGQGNNGDTYLRDTSNSHIQGITSQYTPDGTRHIYWGNDEGRLHERWINGAYTGINLIQDFPEKITGLSSQRTPDGLQHVYSGGDDGQVRETWFNPSLPGSSFNMWPVRNLGSAVLGISSAYTQADGLQHIYTGTASGNLSEIWFGGGRNDGRSIPLDPKPTQITALSSQYTPNDLAQHIYWGAPDGKVRESWFGPTGEETWTLPT